MIIIFTGNGKGKTTAAIGQAIRAIGNGSKVLMVQFIKGPWESGEDKAALRLAPDFKIVKKGKGFVGIGNDKFPIETHRKAAHQGLDYALKEAKSGKWKILILDEVWNAVSLGLLSDEDVETYLDSTKKLVDHQILTGRGCPSKFVEEADIVTEMMEVKHPFHIGIKASKCVEF